MLVMLAAVFIFLIPQFADLPGIAPRSRTLTGRGSP